MCRLALYTFLISALGVPSLLQAAASSLGPLSEYIQAGDDGTWRVVDDGTSAYLENAKTEGAITYYYVGANAGDEGRRTISVDVAFGQITEWSMAGLLYGYTDNPKTYYTFTVRGDSTVNIHQMINGSFEEVLAVPMTSLSAEKTTLTILENGKSVTLSVNGQSLETYTDDQIGQGAVGIVASDIGQYKFSHFSITADQKLQTKKAPLNGGNIMPDAKINSTADIKTAALPEVQINTTAEPAVKIKTTTEPAEPAVKIKTTTEPAEPAVKIETAVEPVKYFPSTDPNYNDMVSSYTPFPASWKQQPGHPEFYYAGPNGIKVSNAFGGLFQFSNNPDGLQMLQMQGQKNTPPYSLQQIIDEFFMPLARKEKRELVKTYPLPAYAQTQADLQARLFKSVPMKESVQAYALEWKDQQGLSYLTVLSVIVSEAFPTSAWFMQGQYVVAENAFFEQARDAFLYGLVHTEINPKWLQAANQRDAQRAGRSWAAHQSRMDAIKARGEASKSIANIYSEISDISHAGYLERSNIQSHGHSASIRATNETTLIANHDTGEHYEVQGNQNYHWVNSNGVHIATDNSLFDPRTDEQLKMFDWSQFQPEQ